MATIKLVLGFGVTSGKTNTGKIRTFVHVTSLEGAAHIVTANYRAIYYTDGDGRVRAKTIVVAKSENYFERTLEEFIDEQAHGVNFRA